MPSRPPSPRPSLPEIQLPTLLVGRVIAHLRERGHDPAALITRYGLPPTVESDPMTVLPVARLHALLDEAAQVAGDPFLGLHVGERSGRDGASLLEFVCRGADDLRGALDRYLRFVATLNEALLVRLEPAGEGAVLRMALPGHALALGRHGNEHWAATLLVIARRLTGAPCIPERLSFAHAAPKSVDEIVRITGCAALEFGADDNAITLGARLLALPLLPGEAPLASMLERYTAMAPPGRPRTSHFHGRLCEALRERLPGGEPSLATIARSLGMSARTLQRRLAEEALTFEGVISAVREDLAKLYVQQPELSVDEIAARLGYAQRSAFLRAFKRWTGTTPRRMRAG